MKNVIFRTTSSQILTLSKNNPEVVAPPTTSMAVSTDFIDASIYVHGNFHPLSPKKSAMYKTNLYLQSVSSSFWAPTHDLA